jgi:hypothetical protein
LLGIAKKAKSLSEDDQWYQYWGFMKDAHIAQRDMDMSGATFPTADLDRVALDQAHINLDADEQGYYVLKSHGQVLGDANGGEVLPFSQYATLAKSQQIGADIKELKYQQAAYEAEMHRKYPSQ